MDYFVYCRDRPGSAALRRQTTEAHWAFMDRYAASMIARGPTLAEDTATPTGSMHILTLPDAAAAHAFAYEEPFYRAGVFQDVLLRRWRNALGRTMWQFEAAPEPTPRFLIIGHGKPGMNATRDSLLDAHRAYFIDNGYQDRFLARGPLLSDDGTEWIGSAMVIEQPSRAAVEAMLAGEPYVRHGLYTTIEIHDWRTGGRH
jgi:uncharacterized protein YciI